MSDDIESQNAEIEDPSPEDLEGMLEESPARTSPY